MNAIFKLMGPYRTETILTAVPSLIFAGIGCYIEQLNLYFPQVRNVSLVLPSYPRNSSSSVVQWRATY